MKRLNLRTLPKLLLLFCTLLLSTAALAVETTGQIQGRVIDRQELAIPGVVVILRSPVLQGDRSRKTGSDGQFQFIELPPGKYKLEATLPGFNTVKTEVVVFAGRTATAITKMRQATAGEEIVVEREAPTIDVTTTQQGLAVTREQMRDIPNASRSYQGVVSQAPGSVDNGTGNNNVRGSLSYGNQYYVDGVNTTDPLTNTFSANINFDIIQEVQVITGGMDAEYGRSMGGVVNVVTRSGGNKFAGDVQLLYDGTETRVYKKLPEEEDDPDPENRSYSAALNFEGPIAKDKLWFITGVQGNLNTYTPAVGDDDYVRPKNEKGKEYPFQSEKWTSAYVFGKLTWRPDKHHTVSLSASADPTNINNAETRYGLYTLPNAETWWQQGGWQASLKHTWTPTQAWIMKTHVASSNSYIRLRPMQWKDCKAYDDAGGCTDVEIDDSPLGAWIGNGPTDFSYGPFPYAYYTERRRQSVDWSITRLQKKLLGDHQIKLGVQGDLMSSHSVSPGLENGIEYWGSTGDSDNLESYVPLDMYRAESNQDASNTGTMVGVYIQDAWQPHYRLTIRPGLRMDTASFQNNVGETVFTSMEFAPRLGAAYDLTGDGRTKLFAYYGRFYDSGFLEIAEIMAKGNNGAGYYSYNANLGEWDADPYLSFADEFLLHNDLVTPYSDEFDVGIERDVGDGWGLGATFTYEHSHNYWEDDEVNLIWNDEGTAIIGSRDGTGEGYYRLRTPDEAWTKYTSMEFKADRQFDEHWGMFASYTWSHAWGRYRDDIAQGLASASFDIPELQDDEVGLMPYDVPDQVKLAGSYRHAQAWKLGKGTHMGWLTGWAMEYTSGFPYRPEYYNPVYGGWYNTKESIDGSYRLPAYSRVDLKAGLTLAQGKTKWDLTAECFNVLNRRTPIGVDTAVDDTDGTIRTDDDGNPSFGQTISRQGPRFFQFGLRGEF